MTGEKGHVHIAEVSLGIGGYRYHTTRIMYVYISIDDVRITPG